MLIGSIMIDSAWKGGNYDKNPPRTADAQFLDDSNRRAGGDVYVFQLAQASAQFAADSGRVRQRKVISGHGRSPSSDGFDNPTWPTCAHYIWPTLSS